MSKDFLLLVILSSDYFSAKGSGIGLSLDSDSGLLASISFRILFVLNLKYVKYKNPAAPIPTAPITKDNMALRDPRENLLNNLDELSSIFENEIQESL